MDRTLSVGTPESSAFSYELAGLGSRFLAVTIDGIIQVTIFIAILWGVLLIAALQPRVHVAAAVSSKTAQSVALACIVAIVFLVFFGYFIVFEAFWNGRTPGKRIMRLRVVRDGGYPLDFSSAAVRNLVRVGEFALGYYAISAAACIASPENKRLGDMAAGTIVVRDAPIDTLAQLVAQSPGVPRSAMLTPREHAIIDEFAVRRRSLAPSVRAEMAARIAARVRPRVSADLQQLPDEELISRLAAS